MKKVFAIILICFTSSLFAAGGKDASSELGISLGISNFLGDLGGANHIGTPFLRDLEPKLFRPDVNVFYRYNINLHWSVKANFMFTRFIGNDNLTHGDVFTDQWYRLIRNLSFKSYMEDLSAQLELNFLKYKPGDKDEYNWTPYIFIGGSIFHFNPTTEFRGEKVFLQPLGTEGQGLPGYADKYHRVTFSVLGGVGVKWNVGDRLSMAWDLDYYQTFTDYIDDVSTVYAKPSDFIAYLPPADAAYVIDIAERRDEIDPTNKYQFVTAAGAQRGDPKDKDQLFTTNLTFAIKLGNIGYGGRGGHRGYKNGRIKCPQW